MFVHFFFAPTIYFRHTGRLLSSEEENTQITFSVSALFTLLFRMINADFAVRVALFEKAFSIPYYWLFLVPVFT